MGFGEGVEFEEGLVGEEMGVVEDEEGVVGVLEEGVEDLVGVVGLSAARGELEVSGESASEAGGAEVGVGGDVEESGVAVEAGLEVAHEGGFAGAGFSEEEVVGGLSSESGEQLGAGVFKVAEIE